MNYLYLVRHGETDWNNSGVIHGRYDIPLNETGRVQANNLEKKLCKEQIDVCICSPMLRTKQTANIVIGKKHHVDVIYDDRLRERHKGVFEGEYVLNSFKSEIKKRYEPYHEFQSRVLCCISEAIDKFHGLNILVVTHKGVLEVLLDEYFKIKHESINNCQCFVVENIKKDAIKLRKGFYAGVFDILHTGHVLAFEECKKYCDYLAVGLQCCPNYKTPIQSIYERYMQIRACKYVDEIIPYYDIDDCKNIINSFDFDIYFLGEDHKNSEWENDKLVESSGKKIVYLSRKHDFSSSNLKNRVVRNYGCVRVDNEE